MKIIKHFLLFSIILTIIIGCSNVEDSSSDEIELPQEKNTEVKEAEVNTFISNDKEVIDYSFTILSDDISIEYGLDFRPKDYISEEDKGKDIIIDNPVDIFLAGDYLVTYIFGDTTKELKVTVLNEEEKENEEIKIISLTSPVNPGKKATIKIKGTPNTTYSITVYYKSGPSKSDDLNSKESDSDGFVAWTWLVGSRTSAGEWEILIESEVDSITTYLKVN